MKLGLEEQYVPNNPITFQEESMMASTASMPVLVTYATRYGSTQEVAEAVAVALRTAGLEVDLQPVRKVHTLAGYRAVVLGAPLYIGAWHKDARRFLVQQRDALTQPPPAGTPIAVFALGPTRADDEQERQGTREQLDQALAKFPWLAPVAVELFGGKYAPDRLRFPDSLLARLPASPLHQAPPSDARDWTAIRAWASRLAVQFQSAGW